MAVDLFNGLLRACVAGYAAAFERWGAMPGFVLLSILIGIAMLWVVGKTSNQRAVERAKKRMQAHLLEMRLFGDDPRLLLRAQKDLLLHNAKYAAHMTRPMLFLAAPMVILYAHLDAVYGRRPLRVGETALVTAKIDPSGAAPSLTASPGIAVETPAVRVPPDGEVSWRVRAVGEGRAELILRSPQGELRKSAVVGGGLAYAPQRRAGSWWRRLLLAPGEDGYDAAAIAWLEIEYPAREIGFGAWRTHWVVWFLLISILAAWLLKSRFGVVL